MSDILILKKVFAHFPSNFSPKLYLSTFYFLFTGNSLATSGIDFILAFYFSAHTHTHNIKLLLFILVY